MRFALLNNWFPPDNFGGTGIRVHRLANILASEGHEVSVLYSRDAFQLRSRGRRQAGLHRHPRMRVSALSSPLGGD